MVYNNNMDKFKIGEIQGYDVLYIPERNSVFCKNTVVKVSTLDRIVRSKEDKGEIPEKILPLPRIIISYALVV